MAWIDAHLGSMEYLGDFYMPRSGGGNGDGNNKNQDAGTEQRRPRNYGAPRVVETDTKDDFPRLQQFYEWEQFLDWADWHGHESRRKSQRTDRKYAENSMAPDSQTAMNLARYGWRDALLQIQGLQKIDLPLNPILQQSYNIHTEYNVAGGAVNIGRYLSGMPDCMRAMRISSAHKLPTRIQKILIIDRIYKDTTLAEILQNGYALYQIIDAMEMANIRTDITLCCAANKRYMCRKDDYDFYETYIKLKRAGEAIYPEKLLFQLAHPAMFRRLHVSVMERNPRSIRAKFDITKYGGCGLYIETWLPLREMMRDALVIESNRVENSMFFVTDMIKSQYDKIR